MDQSSLNSRVVLIDSSLTIDVSILSLLRFFSLPSPFSAIPDGNDNQDDEHHARADDHWYEVATVRAGGRACGAFRACGAGRARRTLITFQVIPGIALVAGRTDSTRDSHGASFALRSALAVAEHS